MAEKPRPDQNDPHFVPNPAAHNMPQNPASPPAQTNPSTYTSPPSIPVGAPTIRDQDQPVPDDRAKTPEEKPELTAAGHPVTPSAMETEAPDEPRDLTDEMILSGEPEGREAMLRAFPDDRHAWIFEGYIIPGHKVIEASITNPNFAEGDVALMVPVGDTENPDHIMAMFDVLIRDLRAEMLQNLHRYSHFRLVANEWKRI